MSQRICWEIAASFNESISLFCYHQDSECEKKWRQTSSWWKGRRRSVNCENDERGKLLGEWERDARVADGASFSPSRVSEAKRSPTFSLSQSIVLLPPWKLRRRWCPSLWPESLIHSLLSLRHLTSLSGPPSPGAAAAVDGSFRSGGLTGRLMWETRRRKDMACTCRCVRVGERKKGRERGREREKKRWLPLSSPSPSIFLSYSSMPPTFALLKNICRYFDPIYFPHASPSFLYHVMVFAGVFGSSSSLEAGEAGLWRGGCWNKYLAWQGKHGWGKWMRNIIFNH